MTEERLQQFNLTKEQLRELYDIFLENNGMDFSKGDILKMIQFGYTFDDFAFDTIYPYLDDEDVAIAGLSRYENSGLYFDEVSFRLQENEKVSLTALKHGGYSKISKSMIEKLKILIGEEEMKIYTESTFEKGKR